MPTKRMFSTAVVETDAFLDLPLSSQALYFHLSMNGDDDGFVNNPKRIVRSIGCQMDDLKQLTESGFITVFQSGVVVINHWLLNNKLRNDRYHPTVYQTEKSLLAVAANRQYILAPELEQNQQLTTNGQPIDNQLTTIGIPTDNQLTTIGIPNITQRNLTQLNSAEQNTYSPERPLDVSEQDVNFPFRFELLTKEDGKTYKVTESELTHYGELYPDIDVEQECRNMIGWLETHRSQRKSLKGTPKFINGWLARVQQQRKASDNNDERIEKPEQYGSAGTIV